MEEVDLVDERDLYVGDNVFWVPETARVPEGERDKHRPDDWCARTMLGPS